MRGCASGRLEAGGGGCRRSLDLTERGGAGTLSPRPELTRLRPAGAHAVGGRVCGVLLPVEEVGALRLLLPADEAGPEEIRPVGSHVRAAGSQGPGVGRLGRAGIPGRCLPFTPRSPHRDAEQDLDSGDPDGTGRPRSSPPLPPPADGLGAEQDPLARMHTGENVGQVPAHGVSSSPWYPHPGPWALPQRLVHAASHVSGRGDLLACCVAGFYVCPVALGATWEGTGVSEAPWHMGSGPHGSKTGPARDWSLCPRPRR